jgi:hypothetical protein
MKLYRYRPLNDFLFKELLYQEIYYASAQELNDPLDLNTQISFYTEDKKKIEALVNFISMKATLSNELILIYQIIDLFKKDDLVLMFQDEMNSCSSQFLSLDQTVGIINKFIEKNEIIHFNTQKLIESIKATFSQFINNSSIACFTQNNDNFLMWSHYASSHYGICLEFEIVDHKFPMEMLSYNGNKSIKWKNKIHKVQYTDTLPKIDFYNFLPVFYNEGDVDLMGISKSCWHPYANELERKFTEKLSPWSSEEEWRIVNISFTHEQPEERIKNFDLDHLKGIIFGAHTTLQSKERIINIFEKKNHNLTYYQAKLDGSKGIVINESEIGT